MHATIHLNTLFYVIFKQLSGFPSVMNLTLYWQFSTANITSLWSSLNKIIFLPWKFQKFKQYNKLKCNNGISTVEDFRGVISYKYMAFRNCTRDCYKIYMVNKWYYSSFSQRTDILRLSCRKLILILYFNIAIFNYVNKSK